MAEGALTAVEAARRLAEDLLFPAALETDRADIVPVELLDALAGAGLYGLAAPAAVGGFDADFATTCQVVEALSSGCLTSAFIWAQHLGAVHAVAQLPDRSWLEQLARGTVRAGLALGGALPRPTLQARREGNGWRLTGSTPWLSGWGRIDVIHTAARDDSGNVVWLLVDAAEGPALSVERRRLVALDATATVLATFSGLLVPDDRVTSIVPYTGGPTPPEVLRIHASFALGVAARCCRLLGPSPLDDALTRCRGELDRLDPETIGASRAGAGELALRAAAALGVATGGRSVLLDDHAQRLVREAFFVLVYALRPESRAPLLARLGGA
jgi:alkylation response protein AidB-like acyl-CoA dehydrogenase